MTSLLPDRATRGRLGAFWWLNFYVALCVLIPFKLALIVNNVVGTEAFASFGNLAAKTPLLLGYDVLGAILVATLIALLCYPMIRRRGAGASLRLPMALAAAVQALHAAFVTINLYVALIIGGPLTKSVIDLATLQEASAAGGGSSPAISSSVARYFDGTFLMVLAMAVLGSVVALAFGPRIGELTRRKRLALRGTLVAMMVTTVLVLPWLINGHLFGIRTHTYGLEKSALVELTGSYLGAFIDRLSHDWASPEDEFLLDMRSAEPAPADAPSNPLRDAVPQKTHVILVSLESVGATYLDDPEVMPFISSVGRRPGGVALPRHYSVWPQTMKAFFALFCAELPYPRYETITMVNPTIPCKSLSEALADAGYFTALVTTADLGYDRKWRFFRHRAFEHVVDMRNMPGRETVWGNSWGLDERIGVQHILDLAREPREKPFFVFYELFTAHHPYDACQAHVDAPLSDDRAAYLRALRYIDDRMKDLIDGLVAAGKMDETLVVIVADHGEGFGQHPGSLSHGAKVYEEVVHVPAVILGPQLANVSGRVELPTSHIDIAPTILGLVGQEVPCTMKGRDLTHSSEPRLVYFGGRPPGGQMGVVDGDWKYILEDTGLEMLFNLRDDPGERVDLADAEPDRLTRYRARIESWTLYSTHLIKEYASVLARSDCRP